jgi:hypothetical protein
MARQAAPLQQPAARETPFDMAATQQTSGQPGEAQEGTEKKQDDKKKNDKEKDDKEKNDDKQKKKKETEGASNDRLFWALPNFLTVENGKQVPPLTTRQKYHESIRESFDYVDYAWYGFLAELSQANNGDPGYGRGALGYAKRYSAEFADGTIENIFTSAVFPVLLHEDPRYYQMGTGGALRRMGYSVSRTVVTRTDDGHQRFNFSEILGSGVAALLSNAYHVAGDRGVALTLNSWWGLVAYDTGQTVVREFWPDIHRKISKTFHRK